MNDQTELKTTTPWTGEMINRAYIPSDDEVKSRAAELRELRLAELRDPLPLE